MRFWVGGYTAEMAGSADGIGELRAGAPDDVLAGGPLGFAGTVARTPGSPSWLAAHPTLDVVYAALEGDGTVQAFRRTGESTFVRHGAPVAVGELVCHVAVDPSGRFLVAACWGDGRVVSVALDAAGRPGAAAEADAAVDPYAGHEAVPASVPASGDIDLAAAARALRAAAGEEYAHLVPDLGEPVAPDATTEDAPERISRAHQTVFLGGGRLVTTDLGFDLVRFWRTDGARLRPVGSVPLPRGTGPRHLVSHPSGHLYVVTEYSDELFVLTPDAAGAWRMTAATPLSPAAQPRDAAAHLALSRDGSFVYAGLRGSDTIATLRVRGQGDRVEPVALTDSGVAWPRHHVVARDTLLVAGQRSDEIASLTLDERTGAPGRVRFRAATPTPTCLLPVR